MYNCLLDLILHTAAVSKDLGARHKFGEEGEIAPLPQRITSHVYLLNIDITVFRQCRIDIVSTWKK